MHVPNPRVTHIIVVKVILAPPAHQGTLNQIVIGPSGGEHVVVDVSTHVQKLPQPRQSYPVIDPIASTKPAEIRSFDIPTHPQSLLTLLTVTVVLPPAQAHGQPILSHAMRPRGSMYNGGFDCVYS